MVKSHNTMCKKCLLIVAVVMIVSCASVNYKIRDSDIFPIDRTDAAEALGRKYWELAERDINSKNYESYIVNLVKAAHYGNEKAQYDLTAFYLIAGEPEHNYGRVPKENIFNLDLSNYHMVVAKLFLSISDDSDFYLRRKSDVLSVINESLRDPEGWIHKIPTELKEELLEKYSK